MTWQREGNTWHSDVLPYRIEHMIVLGPVDPADSTIQRFSVRGDGEDLAVRFSLGRAIAYCEERWRFLDGRL